MRTYNTIYDIADGVYSDLQKASGEKFTKVFGAANPKSLDCDLYILAGNRILCFGESVSRETIADTIWAKFYDSWVRPNVDIDDIDNMNYSISTNGTSKQTTDKTSNQNTQSNDTGFGSDELVTDGSHSQETKSNGTIDHTTNNVVTYKGRNGGDLIGDYKSAYNFKRAIVNNINSDIIAFLTVPIYI